MNWDSEGPPPPVRRVVLLTKPKTSTRLGPMTLAFFRRGEDLEATQFKNLPHDDPALVPPKLGFRSFDRVPRNRAPLMIAFVVAASACVAVLGWPRVRDQAARAATVVGAKVSRAWVHLRERAGPRNAAR